MRKNYRIGIVELDDSFNNEEAVAKYQQTKDLELRNKIIEQNLPLIIRLASDYSYPTKVDKNELITEGTLALIRAIDHYNGRISKFSTYATNVIIVALVEYVDKLYGEGSVYYGTIIKKYRQIAYALFGETTDIYSEEIVDYILRLISEEKPMRPGTVPEIKKRLLSKSIFDVEEEIENIEYEDGEEFNRTEFINKYRKELFGVLSEDEKKLIEDIYINNREEIEIAMENDMSRQSINSKKLKALKKMRRVAKKYL